MDTKDEKEAWLVDCVIKEQEGNITNPRVTSLEMYYREMMAKRFNIGKDWAYEVIRKIVKRNSNFHLQNVWLEDGDGKRHRERELVFIKGDASAYLREISSPCKYVCDECYEQYVKGNLAFKCP